MAARAGSLGVKGLTIMENSIYNGWRYEDVWLDKQVNQPRMIIDLKAAKAHHRAGRSLHGGTGLRHQNRRRAHVVTRTSDDHGRYHHLVACQISQESTTEVAVAHIGPQRPVQRTALFSVKYT